MKETLLIQKQNKREPKSTFRYQKHRPWSNWG